MIEKLVNSKTRLKILKLFLSNIDDRYYLRELERMLEESLSPLRRQLLKLTKMEILIIEEEANLKYYRLNKDFEGLEELRGLVLESRKHAEVGTGQCPVPTLETDAEPNDIYVGNGLPRTEVLDTQVLGTEVKPFPTRRFRYDIALLSFISIFVLITAIFVVYTNTKNIKQVAKLIAGELLPLRVGEGLKPSPTATYAVSPAGNGEMISRKWKILPGSVPVLSSGETGEEKKGKEL